jgi:hypothetical protein
VWRKHEKPKRLLFRKTMKSLEIRYYYNYYIISVIITVVTIFREHFSDCKARSGRWLWHGAERMLRASRGHSSTFIPPRFKSCMHGSSPENTEIPKYLFVCFFLRFLDFRDLGPFGRNSVLEFGIQHFRMQILGKMHRISKYSKKSNMIKNAAF